MDDRTYLLNNNGRKKNKKSIKLKNTIIILFVLSFISLLSIHVTEVFLERNEYYFKESKNELFGKEDKYIKFVSLYNNGTKGPITTDRSMDDGKKFNIYSMIKETNESFDSSFYDYDTFKKLNNIVKRDEEYFCELGLPSEAYDGYYLTCPTHYTIVVDKADYGRYQSDITHCLKDSNNEYLSSSKVNTDKDCIVNKLATVKEMCDGRTECNLKPNSSFFGNPCEHLYKYLYVKYHCKKDEEMKKSKFAIVIFADRIKSNSIYEHAISELYQYADYHGYKFLFFEKNYNSGRPIFYMKLHSVHEAISRGLKTKEYDWVVINKYNKINKYIYINILLTTPSHTL